MLNCGINKLGLNKFYKSKDVQKTSQAIIDFLENQSYNLKIKYYKQNNLGMVLFLVQGLNTSFTFKINYNFFSKKIISFLMANPQDLKILYAKPLMLSIANDQNITENSETNQDNSIVNQNNSIVNQNNSIVNQNNSIVNQNNSIVNQNNSIVNQNNSIVNQDNSIVHQDNSTVHQDNSIVNQNNSIVNQGNSKLSKLMLEGNDKNINIAKNIDCTANRLQSGIDVLFSKIQELIFFKQIDKDLVNKIIYLSYLAIKTYSHIEFLSMNLEIKEDLYIVNFFLNNEKFISFTPVHKLKTDKNLILNNIKNFKSSVHKFFFTMNLYDFIKINLNEEPEIPLSKDEFKIIENLECSIYFIKNSQLIQEEDKKKYIKSLQKWQSLTPKEKKIFFKKLEKNCINADQKNLITPRHIGFKKAYFSLKKQLLSGVSTNLNSEANKNTQEIKNNGKDMFLAQIYKEIIFNPLTPEKENLIRYLVFLIMKGLRGNLNTKLNLEIKENFYILSILNNNEKITSFAGVIEDPEIANGFLNNVKKLNYSEKDPSFLEMNLYDYITINIDEENRFKSYHLYSSDERIEKSTKACIDRILEDNMLNSNLKKFYMSKLSKWQTLTPPEKRAFFKDLQNNCKKLEKSQDTQILEKNNHIQGMRQTEKIIDIAAKIMEITAETTQVPEEMGGMRNLPSEQKIRIVFSIIVKFISGSIIQDKQIMQESIFTLMTPIAEISFLLLNFSVNREVLMLELFGGQQELLTNFSYNIKNKKEKSTILQNIKNLKFFYGNGAFIKMNLYKFIKLAMKNIEKKDPSEDTVKDIIKDIIIDLNNRITKSPLPNELKKYYILNMHTWKDLLPQEKKAFFTSLKNECKKLEGNIAMKSYDFQNIKKINTAQNPMNSISEKKANQPVTNNQQEVKISEKKANQPVTNNQQEVNYSMKVENIQSANFITIAQDMVAKLKPIDLAACKNKVLIEKLAAEIVKKINFSFLKDNKNIKELTFSLMGALEKGDFLLLSIEIQKNKSIIDFFIDHQKIISLSTPIRKIDNHYMAILNNINKFKYSTLDKSFLQINLYKFIKYSLAESIDTDNIRDINNRIIFSTLAHSFKKFCIQKIYKWKSLSKDEKSIFLKQLKEERRLPVCKNEFLETISSFNFDLIYSSNFFYTLTCKEAIENSYQFFRIINALVNEEPAVAFSFINSIFSGRMQEDLENQSIKYYLEKLQLFVKINTINSVTYNLFLKFKINVHTAVVQNINSLTHDTSLDLDVNNGIIIYKVTGQETQKISHIYKIQENIKNFNNIKKPRTFQKNIKKTEYNEKNGYLLLDLKSLRY
jgi:hypothetical protein